MKKVMLVFGTRLEGIVTGQHREMLGQVLRIFEVVPDCELNIMKQARTSTMLRPAC